MATNLINKIKYSPVDIEARKKLDFKSGDTVRVWSKIAEEKAGKKKGEKATLKFRLQAFEGIVLARKHGGEAGATFTVRKTASGVGVERIFPLYSPNIDKIEVLKKSNSRKAKLYYVRDKAVKDVRKKLRSITNVKGQAMGEDDVETVDETKEEEAEETTLNKEE